MVQVAQRNGGDAAPVGQQPGPVDQAQIDALIAEAEQKLKETQQQLADLTARKAAKSAREQEKTTSDKAVQTAFDKIGPALQQADELLEESERIADKLSDEQVQGIETAVDDANEEHDRLRQGLEESIGAVADRMAKETTAKAGTANAKAATAEAKRMLGDRMRSIDQEIARISALVTETRTAITQGQIPTAYLLLADLQQARDRLDEMADADEITQLQQAVEAAWTEEQDASAGERAATWEVTRAREAQQTAQTKLTQYESGRRATLNTALEELGKEGGGARKQGGGQEIVEVGEQNNFGQEDEGQDAQA